MINTRQLDRKKSDDIDQNRITVLQSVRGMAIVLVVVSHCNKMIYNDSGKNALNWFGAFGVSLFILLSGYLAFYKYHDKSLDGYYKGISHRIRKFYPLHYITLFLSIPLCLYEFKDKIITGILKLAINGALLQSWIPRRSVYFSFNLVSWYLSTMVFFVIITPFVVRALKRLEGRRVLYIFGACIVLIESCLAILMPKNLEITHWLTYICPVTRSLDFFAGGVCYAISIYGTKLIKSKRMYMWTSFIGAVICALLLIASTNGNSELFSTAIWTIPSAFILLCASLSQTFIISKNFFKNRLFVYLGNISFELFIIHYLIIQYYERLWNIEGWNVNFVMYILAILSSIIVANSLHSYRKNKRLI